MNEFPRMKRLPPYVFGTMEKLKQQVTAKGIDVFDMGLGNPDQPTAPHIVEALRQAAGNPAWHRYSPSRGIPELRHAICRWYGERFNVDLDPETETIFTIGSKEGLAHLALATVGAGDSVVVPNPCYPVHHYGFVIADAEVKHVPNVPEVDFLTALEETIKDMNPKPKMMVINFPGNPTTECVDLAFFERVVAIAKEHKVWVVQDLAYADLVFDGYKAPSILQVPGAKEIAVESYTLSKTYNMAGWRVGFISGNATLVAALARIKSYIDYGSFAPVQVAAIAALQGPQDSVKALCDLYKKRRDFMAAGLRSAGWEVNLPKATMFMWLKIPEPFQQMGSFEFAKLLLQEAHVVVSPGVGFGDYGDSHVRISLVEDEVRMQHVLNNIHEFMRCDLEKPILLEKVNT